MTLEQYLDYLVKFIQDSVKKAHANGVIVGVSGGIDSAVVASLAQKAFPNNYLTTWMPINSSKEDWDCATELIKTKKMNSATVDLEPVFDTMVSQINKSGQEISDLASANIKARLRMTNLYALAQTNNYLVLGTDNADEWYIGYFTKFGDGGVDIVPIIHLLKGEVKQAAKLLGVPESIINRQPSAGLWEGQTDENEIGFSYAQIDDYLKTRKSDDKKFIERIEGLHTRSEHKRHPAVQPQGFDRK